MPAIIAQASVVFDRLRSLDLPGGASLDLIMKVAETERMTRTTAAQWHTAATAAATAELRRGRGNLPGVIAVRDSKDTGWFHC